MDKQLIDDLYKDLDEKMPKVSDGVYANYAGWAITYINDTQIGSIHYKVQGLKITDCDALKVVVEKGSIMLSSFQKKDQYKLQYKVRKSIDYREEDRFFEIWVDSVPGVDIRPMSGIKKEVLEFMKLYGYHFCETLYPEDMGANEIEYKKSCGDWHGAEGEEERFLAYNPYEEHEGAERYWDFYIKKN